MLKRKISRARALIRSKKFFDLKKHVKKLKLRRLKRFFKVRDRKKIKLPRMILRLNFRARAKKALLLRLVRRREFKKNRKRIYQWDYTYEELKKAKEKWYPRRKKRWRRKFRTSRQKLFGYRRKALKKVARLIKKKTRKNKFKKVRFLFRNNTILKIKKIPYFSFEDEENNLKSFYLYIDSRIKYEALKKSWILNNNYYFLYWYVNIFNFKIIDVCSI